MLRRLRNLKRKAVGNGAEKQANQPRISLEESPIMRVAIEQVGRGLPANLAQKFAAAFANQGSDPLGACKHAVFSNASRID